MHEITSKEAQALLDLAIKIFEGGGFLSRELRQFIVRIYDKATFYANGVNPDEFTDWLNK